MTFTGPLADGSTEADQEVTIDGNKGTVSKIKYTGDSSSGHFSYTDKNGGFHNVPVKDKYQGNGQYTWTFAAADGKPGVNIAGWNGGLLGTGNATVQVGTAVAATPEPGPESRARQPPPSLFPGSQGRLQPTHEVSPVDRKIPPQQCCSCPSATASAWPERSVHRP